MKARKRVLALLMSAVMLTGEAMTVFAQEDASVAVSENEAVSEDAEAVDEAAAPEETAVAEETAAAEETAVSEESAAVEEVVVAEGSAAEASEPAVDEVIEVSEEAGGFIINDDGEEVRVVPFNAAAAGCDDCLVINETTGTTTVSRKNKTINAGSVDGIDGTVNVTVEFNGSVEYRGRKINAEKDLSVSVKESGIYSAASKMAGSPVSKELITWKYSATKKKEAGSPSSFTVKAKLNKKVAKSYGIGGKNLKALNKAVKALNKAAKTDPVSFTIAPADFGRLCDNNQVQVTLMYKVFLGLKTYTGYKMTAQLDPFKPTKKTKVKKTEFIVEKDTYMGKRVYWFTPAGKNFTGEKKGFIER